MTRVHLHRHYPLANPTTGPSLSTSKPNNWSIRSLCYNIKQIPLQIDRKVRQACSSLRTSASSSQIRIKQNPTTYVCEHKGQLSKAIAFSITLHTERKHPIQIDSFFFVFLDRLNEISKLLGLCSGIQPLVRTKIFTSTLLFYLLQIKGLAIYILVLQMELGVEIVLRMMCKG